MKVQVKVFEHREIEGEMSLQSFLVGTLQTGKIETMQEAKSIVELVQYLCDDAALGHFECSIIEE